VPACRHSNGSLRPKVNRWSQLYAAAGKRFGKWKGARVASDPRNVPDYLEPED